MVFSFLLSVFILMPIAEIAVLLRVHDAIGLFDTLMLVIVTGFAGAFLARQQGMMLLFEIRREMAEGRMPAPRLMDGVMILIAGVLLITPGLITDAVGFLLLVPVVRAAIRHWLRRKISSKLRDGSVDTTVWRW
jgi:UPF0716 protein FxsA